jgi:hypothetical protein
MKNYKLSRNLWLFAGLCFFLSFLLNLFNKQLGSLSGLNAVTSILMFINAYINHKKITKENKDIDD